MRKLTEKRFSLATMELNNLFECFTERLGIDVSYSEHIRPGEGGTRYMGGFVPVDSQMPSRLCEGLEAWISSMYASGVRRMLLDKRGFHAVPSQGRSGETAVWVVDAQLIGWNFT